MKHKDLKKRVKDALFTYSEAKLFGPFGGLQKKREEFERLRTIYEKRHGKFSHVVLGIVPH